MIRKPRFEIVNELVGREIGWSDRLNQLTDEYCNTLKCGYLMPQSRANQKYPINRFRCKKLNILINRRVKGTGVGVGNRVGVDRTRDASEIVAAAGNISWKQGGRTPTL